MKISIPIQTTITTIIMMILITTITMKKSEEIVSPIELHTLKSGYQAFRYNHS